MNEWINDNSNGKAERAGVQTKLLLLFPQPSDESLMTPGGTFNNNTFPKSAAKNKKTTFCLCEKQLFLMWDFIFVTFMLTSWFSLFEDACLKPGPGPTSHWGK